MPKTTVSPMFKTFSKIPLLETYNNCPKTLLKT